MCITLLFVRGFFKILSYPNETFKYVFIYFIISYVLFPKYNSLHLYIFILLLSFILNYLHNSMDLHMLHLQKLQSVNVALLKRLLNLHRQLHHPSLPSDSQMPLI